MALKKFDSWRGSPKGTLYCRITGLEVRIGFVTSVKVATYANRKSRDNGIQPYEIQPITIYKDILKDIPVPKGVSRIVWSDPGGLSLFYESNELTEGDQVELSQALFNQIRTELYSHLMMLSQFKEMEKA